MHEKKTAACVAWCVLRYWLVHDDAVVFADCLIPWATAAAAAELTVGGSSLLVALLD